MGSEMCIRDSVNFGLFPPMEAPKTEGKRLRGKEKTVAKKKAMAARALSDFGAWNAAHALAEAS